MATQSPSENGSIAIGDVANLAAVIEKQASRIRELEDRVAALENATDERDDRLERVLAHAERIGRGDTAALSYSDVMAAAGVSAPTAYAYMDELVQTNDRVRRDLKHETDAGKRRILVDPPR